jgi:hypothetical protein
MEEGVEGCAEIPASELASLSYDTPTPALVQAPQGFWELASLLGVVSVPEKPHD